MLERTPPTISGSPVDLPEPVVAGRVRFGLAGRILWLMVAFVMLAEVAIYVPSIASYRNAWLHNRLASARTAALVFQATPADMVPQDLSRQILDSVGARILVLTARKARRLLAVSDMPTQVDEVYDLRDPTPGAAIAAAFRCLMAPRGRMLSVLDTAADGTGTLEITLDETPLRQALRAYSADVLLSSLVISTLVAALAVAAIHFLVLRPVRRLTSSIVAFGEDPEDATRIVVPSHRSDEIGRAETALRGMQAALARELGQKKRLAAMGLAVAKINHDLRNMLSSAQLVSDRLSNLSDPLTQRLAPRLVATLDRAIAFCEATLAYGRPLESPPVLRRVPLRPLVEDVFGTVLPAGPGRLALENAVAEGFEVTADPDGLFRVLMNLCRNAVQALEGGRGTLPPRLVVSARREGARVLIEVADTGPGIAPRARAGLFAPFQGSTRAGGTGLGLSIATDLVRAHGGTLSLVEGGPGARFAISLPDRPPPTGAQASSAGAREAPRHG